MLAEPDYHFDLSEWRITMRRQRLIPGWLNRLDQTLCGIHEKAHKANKPELTCVELIDQLLGDTFLAPAEKDQPLNITEVRALKSAAKSADQLNHAYHRGPHIREVILCTIALIEWIESAHNKNFPLDFKYNAVATALIHDMAHPGQYLAKNIKTESEALAEALGNHYQHLSAKRLNAITIGTLATAQDFFPDMAELQKRFLDNQSIITRHLKAKQLNPQIADHMELAAIISLADILPSLVSPKRLLLGSMKFIQELDSPKLTTPNVFKVAAGFTGAVQKAHQNRNSPFERFGIPFHFGKLHAGMACTEMHQLISGKINAPKVAQAIADMHRDFGPGHS